MLKEYLEKNNISVYSLAKKSGIPYSTLNDLSNGKVTIDACKVSVLKNIALGLGLSLNEAYDICTSKPVEIKTSYGIEANVSVKNKSYFCDFEYNGSTVELELCKVNEETKFYINEIAKWRTEGYIRKKRIEEFE